MRLTYWTSDNVYIDDAVTSVVGDKKSVIIFCADYGPSHHKYLIEEGILKRYELTSSFYRVQQIRNWSVSA